VQIFITDRRKEKIRKVITARQQSLRVVMENVHDPHNVSAVFRTCDATGVPKVSLLYNIEKFPKIGKKSSASAFKWIEKEKHTEVKSCYESLHEQGFKIYASALAEDAVSLYDLDLTEKTAIVLGNEHRGISDEAASMADKKFIIPMFGMVQSLNISVAAAVILYEAARQRMVKGMYDKSDLTDEEFTKIYEKWCNK
jgi:tRNA (guanosine-2'-O-)-methyltransferase